MENNIEPPITNYQPENPRPEIEMPSQIVSDSKPKKNKLKIPLIILIILTVGSLTFGVFEYVKNLDLKSEIEDLKAKIETPEKPEEPKIPSEKIYSGTFEYSYSDHGEREGPIEADTPEQNYTVTLNYDTGELYMKKETIGNCPNTVCDEEEFNTELTEKELTKIWLITLSEDYDKSELTEALYDISIDSVFSTSREKPTDCVNENGDTAGTDCEMKYEEQTNCADENETNCLTVSYRETGNALLDEILFNIYGWINCMPQSTNNSENNIVDCNGGPEGTDCEETQNVEIKPNLNCKIAEEIDYPYIAN